MANCIETNCEHVRCEKMEFNGHYIKAVLNFYCELGHPCITVFGDNGTPLNCWDYKEHKEARYPRDRQVPLEKD